MPALKFPEGFLWGAATAAYQVEGSPTADGAGESIWDRFVRSPHTIRNADTGDVACDQYNRCDEDVQLMRRLGLQAYRFSIAWSRVLPAGRGPVNRAGLDYYERLVDALLAAGIEPFPTLYHWDLPQALEDAGGWAHPDSAKWFADYAQCVFETLGDRVRRWISFNEPWVFIWLGYALGVHAPGRADNATALAAGHNVLLANGRCIERFRNSVPAGEIGIALSVQAYVPASDAPADAAAAERMCAFNNYWFSDPILRGSYPEALNEEFGSSLPTITEEDRAIIARPVDFIGLNYYTRYLIGDDENEFLRAKPLPIVGQRTQLGWEVYPAGLHRVLRAFAERYGLPLYITENGAAFDDPAPDATGTIDDWDRLRYLQSHLEMAHRAISEGVDLRGFMVWSLLDNFEWTFGYSARFGIVHCDFETQQRTIKQSGAWYARVIADNGV